MNSVSHDSRRAFGAGAAPDTEDWYVYYRVRTEHAAFLHARVSAMQDGLLQQCGVAGALKRHPQQRDGLHTWMEVYLAAPSDFDAILAAAARSAGLADLIEGERHVEHFWDITQCA